MGEVFALQDGITIESYPFNERTGMLVSGSDSRANPFRIYLNGEMVEALISQISKKCGEEDKDVIIALSSGITSNRHRDGVLLLYGSDDKDRTFFLRIYNKELQLLQKFIQEFSKIPQEKKDNGLFDSIV